MREFRGIRAAAGYALRCPKPAFVFDGPDGGFIVALGREARGLISDGHIPLTLTETVSAAR